MVSEANEPGSESGKRSDDRRGVPEGTPQEGGASSHSVARLPPRSPGSFAAAAMATRTASSALLRLERRLTRCRLCPRLVEHRERVGREKVARFRAWTYWARPVPGFGDPAARLLVVGLAGRARGQPDRAHVHRRRERQLALR